MKRIIAITGKSGSGKSMIARYIEDVHGIPRIRDYTDRPERGERDTEYEFVSREEMDALLQGDVLTETRFGGHRYCSLERDAGEKNVHVVDERGIDQLLAKGSYDVTTVYVEAKTRRGGSNRLGRDEGAFQKEPSDYDYVINNDAGREKAFRQVDRILLEEGYIPETI